MFRSEYPWRRGRLLGEDVFPGPRLLQKVMDNFFQDVWEPNAQPLLSGMTAFSPHIDVEEDERQVRVFAELPGLTENDIEIVYEPGSIVLRGEKKEEERRESPRERGRYEERRYGAFERRIPLRAEIQEDQIQATFDRGVLTISLPKTPEARAQARRISIRGGAPSGQIEQQGKGRAQPPSEGAGAAAH